jgi:hypothetical protein
MKNAGSNDVKSVSTAARKATCLIIAQNFPTSRMLSEMAIRRWHLMVLE